MPRSTTTTTTKKPVKRKPLLKTAPPLVVEESTTTTTTLPPAKSYWYNNINRNYVIIGSIILLLLALLLISTCNNKKKDGIIASKDKEIQLITDANGNSHVKVVTQPVSAGEKKKIYDSIAKVIGQKPRTIIKYVKASASIDTNLVIDRHKIIVHDTVYSNDGDFTVKDREAYQLEYSDGTFLTISGVVPSDPQTLYVAAKAELTFTQYFKKKWFLGAKHYYTDIGTNNPYIKFTNATAFETTPNAKFKVRPGVGVGLNYNPISKKFSPGIQAGLFVFYSR